MSINVIQIKDYDGCTIFIMIGAICFHYKRKHISLTHFIKISPTKGEVCLICLDSIFIFVNFSNLGFYQRTSYICLFKT